MTWGVEGVADGTPNENPRWLEALAGSDCGVDDPCALDDGTDRFGSDAWVFRLRYCPCFEIGDGVEVALAEESLPKE